MDNKVEYLLSHPDKLLQKPPFYREIDTGGADTDRYGVVTVAQTATVTARLPRIRKRTVSQETFVKELSAFSHDVLFDDNIPSITVKANKRGYLDIRQHRMAMSFQEIIRNKQVRHLCVNRMVHTLLNTKPTEKQMRHFVRIKQMWAEKNMEGAKTKFVQDQKSYGDAGLLFVLDKQKRLHTKNINFEDGYVIITHKDDLGKHILECLYYAVTDEEGNTIERIDCYDEKYMTRLTNTMANGGQTDAGWVRHAPIEHGFSEIPLVTKRGEVAWNRGQNIIESYEALLNTFIVIQKRFGWGQLYIKGKFNQNAKKIGGSVVLNDNSMDPNADAKYLNPPSPQNMIETLELMEYCIQKATGTTFILPKDIKISGDTSGLAVQLTQELDMATAQDGVIEWQNAANKMMRLFKEGVAKELIKSGEEEYKNALTDFETLRIHAEFIPWQPKSEEAHNQMLVTLRGSGGISQQTFVEKNTISTPDEMMRIQKEHEAELREAEEAARREAELTANSENTQETNVVNVA